MRSFILIILLILTGCAYSGPTPFPVGSKVKYKTGNLEYEVIRYENNASGNQIVLMFGEGYIKYLSPREFDLIQKVEE